ncbi:hypothetical protein TNCT_524751 [Trichonephila clavata]|uniref:Uncharacterized protein n=1 Tax=Trichonephila clavata TaxID=2740835 RepID=A0A8X6KN02_TRICU|nr:hypothetical protein TNCT_524751 [Trichonephila clavata]
MLLRHNKLLRNISTFLRTLLLFFNALVDKPLIFLTPIYIHFLQKQNDQGHFWHLVVFHPHLHCLSCWLLLCSMVCPI